MTPDTVIACIVGALALVGAWYLRPLHTHRSIQRRVQRAQQPVKPAKRRRRRVS